MDTSRPSSSGYQRSEGSDGHDVGDELFRKQPMSHAMGAGYRELWQRVSQVNPGEPTIVSDCTVEDMLRTIKTLQNKQNAIDVLRAGAHYLDSRALAFLLKELGKCKLTHRAFEIFDWLHMHPDPSLSSLCDVFTYTTVISLCGSPRLLWKALRLVGSMKSKGIPCNTHTYSALISVCVKAKQPGLALDVYQEMKRSGCKPSVVTYNTLVDAYGKAGLWQEAISVLDTMIAENIAPEARTINSVIRDCCECWQPTAAYKVFSKFRGVGLMPTQAIFTNLITTFCDANQAAEAYRVLEEQVACGVERTAASFASLLDCVEHSGGTAHPLLLPLLQKMQADNVSLEAVRRARMAALDRTAPKRSPPAMHSPQRLDPRGGVSTDHPQQAFPQHLNFQELLQLAQQQPPAPPMQQMLGQLGGSRDVLSQHATAQSLGLTMSMPGLHGARIDSWPGAHPPLGMVVPQDSSYTAGQSYYQQPADARHFSHTYSPHPLGDVGGMFSNDAVIAAHLGGQPAHAVHGQPSRQQHASSQRSP